MASKRRTFLTFAILIFLAPNLFGQDSKTSASLTIAIVVAPFEFTDQEFTDPLALFKEANAQITIVGTTTQAAISHDGVRINPERAIPDLQPNDFDAIFLVGGKGAVDYLLRSTPLRNLLLLSGQQHKVSGAICLAPTVLAAAGMLKDMEATCYTEKSVIDFLEKNGAKYVDRSVVVSGNIVTGNGPDAAKDVARAMLSLILDNS